MLLSRVPVTCFVMLSKFGTRPRCHACPLARLHAHFPTLEPYHGKGLPLAALHARVHLPSIQEQPAFCVLYNPL